MNFVALILLFLYVNVISKESEELFKFDADNIFKSVIGREADLNRETTHAVPDIFDEENTNFTKRIRNDSKTFINKNRKIEKIDKLKNNSDKTENIKGNHTAKNKENPIKTVADIVNRMRELEIERIFENELNPLPNFDKNEDDTSLITRRFDKLKKEIAIGDSRRKNIRARNVIRNRTISIMEHFMYATRYKLPYSQLLRAKYYDSERYRIGFCFGLLYQLKRQQFLMFTQMTLQQYNLRVLHFHMKLYEKVVRLDVDIKDTMRLIREYESKRRVKEDPNYYDTYEEPRTRPGP